MDMRMPVMDGYEATKRIKATTQGQATIIVALTASAFEEDRAMILSQGCDDFVRKPFREEEIFDVLAKHLGVGFVYEDQADARPSARLPSRPDVLSRAELAALPGDWVEELYQAATRLDADVALELLDQIRAQNSKLANGLARLVHDFRFDTIMALTKAVEEEYEQ
jgi:CheY-like chemotaxis protein